MGLVTKRSKFSLEIKNVATKEEKHVKNNGVTATVIEVNTLLSQTQSYL